MHEMSFLYDVIKKVEGLAKQKGLSKVSTIEIEVGELCGYEDDHLKEGFEIVSRGTICEGANIKVDKVDAFLKCKNCQHEFHPENIFLLICPECYKQSFDVVQGNESALKDFE